MPNCPDIYILKIALQYYMRVLTHFGLQVPRYFDLKKSLKKNRKYSQRFFELNQFFMRNVIC